MARFEKFLAHRLSCAAGVLLLAASIVVACWPLIAEETGETEKSQSATVAASSPKDAAEQPAETPADPPAAPVTPAVERAVKRLRELGAGASPTSVGFMCSNGWKGTSADLKLINDLPDLRNLEIDLGQGDAEVLSELKLPPLDKLSLYDVKDSTLALVTRLPQCRELQIHSSAFGNMGRRSEPSSPVLTAVGYRRLVGLVSGVKSLQIPWGAHGAVLLDNEGLKALCELKDLEKLALYSAAVTDAGLAPLASLEKLHKLDLIDFRQVNGPGLAALRSLPLLRDLGLSGIQCNGEGFRALASLAHLEELDVALVDFPAPGLKPADFAGLKDLMNLQTFRISRWTGAGGLLGSTDFKQDALLADVLLAAIGQIPTIKSLDVGAIATSGEGVEGLAAMPHLESLGLSPIQLNKRALAALGKLTELRHLSLVDAQTVVDDLHDLAHCTHLTDLRLANGCLGHEALNRLVKIRSLAVLDLSHCDFCDDWATPLDKLTSLKQLDLSETNARDQMLETLPPETIATIEVLRLDKSQVTAKVFESIAKMKNLRELTIDESITTADELRTLRPLAHLKSVMVMSRRSNTIGEEEMQADRLLEEALPGKVSVSSDDWG